MKRLPIILLRRVAMRGLIAGTLAGGIYFTAAGCKRHPAFPLPEVSEKKADATSPRAEAPAPAKSPDTK